MNSAGFRSHSGSLSKVAVSRNCLDLSPEIVKQYQGKVSPKELGELLRFERDVQRNLADLKRDIRYPSSFKDQKSYVKLLWANRAFLKNEPDYLVVVEVLRRIYLEVLGEKPTEDST